MMTGAERQARYRAAQAARVAQLEAALRTAHGMLTDDRASFTRGEWDRNMGRIEAARTMAAPAAAKLQGGK